MMGREQECESLINQLVDEGLRTRMEVELAQTDAFITVDILQSARRTPIRPLIYLPYIKNLNLDRKDRKESKDRKQLMPKGYFEVLRKGNYRYRRLVQDYFKKAYVYQERLLAVDRWEEVQEQYYRELTRITS